MAAQDTKILCKRGRVKTSQINKAFGWTWRRAGETAKSRVVRGTIREGEREKSSREKRGEKERIAEERRQSRDRT